MTDESIINEFTRLYSEGNSIDEAMDKLSKIIPPAKHEDLIKGLKNFARLMK